jgi:hypothetical protein
MYSRDRGDPVHVKAFNCAREHKWYVASDAGTWAPRCARALPLPKVRIAALSHLGVPEFGFPVHDPTQ